MSWFDSTFEWIQNSVAKPIEGQLWRPIADALFSKSEKPAEDEATREKARKDAPTIWLLGKTGTGKSSIVQALTGVERATIGNGYAPCTRATSVFEFPEEAPIIRFLDTRGLEEPDYDPTADVEFCSGVAHFIIVTMQAMDPDQARVLSVVKKARQRNPSWPVLVAQTTLHGGYKRGSNHPLPYPFINKDAGVPPGLPIPENLRSALLHQRERFQNLPGAGVVRFAAIDLTTPEDDYNPPDYGLDELRHAISELAPEALSAFMDAAQSTEKDTISRAAKNLILGYAFAAMIPAAIPVPFVNLAAIATIDAAMLHALGRRYGIEWTPCTFGEFTTSLGTGVLFSQLIKYGGQELAKLIPVYGQAAGLVFSAAGAFAFTYALGIAASTYLAYRRRGLTAPSAAIRDDFARALREGFDQIKRRRQSPNSENGAI